MFSDGLTLSDYSWDDDQAKHRTKRTKNARSERARPQAGVSAVLFRTCGLSRVVFPSTLRELGRRAFCGCACLRSVEFPEGSRLERIGEGCF